MSVTKIKKICFLFIFCSSCFSQGYMNAIGLGKFYSNQGVKNAVDGICSLSPSVSKNVNFSNPSTWHNLKFTYLSLSYSADHTSLESESSTNAYSGLSNALWIIPFKSKYSVNSCKLYKEVDVDSLVIVHQPVLVLFFSDGFIVFSASFFKFIKLIFDNLSLRSLDTLNI